MTDTNQTDLIDDLVPVDLDAGDLELRQAADVTLARIAWHEHRLDDINQIFSPELARLRLALDAVEERQAEAEAAPNASLTWHRSQLQAIIGALLARNPKLDRTLHLPHGSIAVTVYSKPVVQIVDRDLVQMWMEANRPEVVGRVFRKVGVTMLGEVGAARDGMLVTADGEIVPGCVTAVPPPRVADQTVGGDF